MSLVPENMHSRGNFKEHFLYPISADSQPMGGIVTPRARQNYVSYEGVRA